MKQFVILLMVIAGLGVAQGESSYESAADVQGQIEGLLQSGAIKSMNGEEMNMRSSVLHHPPAPGSHGWYLGCYSADYYGYVYDSYGYNAYSTQAGANNSCLAWSPAAHTCYQLGCEVYYY